MSADETVQVLIGDYDPSGQYTRHAGVLIASIFANTKSKVNINLLHDATLTEDNRLKLMQLAEKFGQTITLVDVSSQMDSLDFDADKIAGGNTRGTLFRLLAPDVLHLDKIIYFDCDIVVNLDINELWKIDVSNYALAGVLDNSSINKGARSSMSLLKTKAMAMGFVPGEYINAGVIVMNLDKIRKHGELAALAAHYFAVSDAELADQDFLNKEFQNEILLIDEKFNTEPKEASYENGLYGYVWHFVGFGKPWKMITGTNADILYWQFLERTPWRDELVPSIMKAATNEELYHRHSEACIKRLLKQLKTNVARTNPLPILKNRALIMMAKCHKS